MEEEKQFYPPSKGIWNIPSIATTQWVQISTPSFWTKLSFKTQIPCLSLPQLPPRSYMLPDNYCIVLLTRSRKNHIISPETGIGTSGNFSSLSTKTWGARFGPCFCHLPRNRASADAFLRGSVSAESTQNYRTDICGEHVSCKVSENKLNNPQKDVCNSLQDNYCKHVHKI